MSIIRDFIDDITIIDTKVDKVVGKQLSTEDYSTSEKSKLAGIAAGAQVNVETDLSLGAITGTSITLNSSTGTDVSIPSATTITSGLMSDADKSKLDGIATYANNYVLPARLAPAAQTIADWNLAIENGWYMGYKALNGPTADWNLGIVETHNSDWVTQTVHSFTVDGSSNSAVWRRHKNGGTWTNWYRLQLTQEEQDARYVQGNDSRLITNGDQTWSGVKTFISSPIVPTPTTGTQAANKNYVDSVANSSSGTLTGTIITFAATTAPTGYLKCNGALVSRSTYANLFAAIGTTFGAGNGSTTFALPDLRGYFPRGWDDGRGIDTGRVFGSLQADELKSHTHTSLSTASAYAEGRASNVFGFASSPGETSSSGGTETRPKNIALLYCIKY